MSMRTILGAAVTTYVRVHVLTLIVPPVPARSWLDCLRTGLHGWGMNCPRTGRGTILRASFVTHVLVFVPTFFPLPARSWQELSILL